ncbi:FG-GAP-like repeat-containing protein [Streptomyces sp.]|uniref:FG-GAP-like repeat-containing protein n=1 Tax=Streptomyces sp. TaxID=1931 RepID=UPI002811AD19|nr:FG-GAP-like repeat-containing protein [Streptomyces sp.]
MPLARPVRRRLTAAVTTVLAVTLGAGVLTTPAHAAPATTATTAPATTTDPVSVRYPGSATLTAAGVTGFLTRDQNNLNRWQRYADGGGQAYDGRVEQTSTRTTDYLVHSGLYQVTQRNLRTFGALDVPLSSAADGPKYAGAAGDAVFTTVTGGTGTVLRKHTEAQPNTAVTGLPADATRVKVAPGTPDHALVTFAQGTAAKWGLVDLTTGAVGTIRDGMAAPTADRAVSPTHVAWVEGDNTQQPRLFVLDRATDEVREVPLPDVWSGDLQIGLAGGWVVYGEGGGFRAPQQTALHPLTARNLATGTTVKLLDHVLSSAAAPDGSLYVRGGLLGRGEGLYRITATGDTTPQAVMVATTGEPTEVVLTGDRAPRTVDLDAADGARFAWDLSRDLKQVTVTLRHVRTGRTAHTYVHTTSSGQLTYDWNGHLGDHAMAAYNGAYTWHVTGKPANGLGPDLDARGTFTVVREPAPHDFNDNGTPDLLTRDAAGRLWRTDTLHSPEYGELMPAEPKASLGSGWNIYDRIEATGDLGGSAVGDLLTRDTSGALWLYQGTGTGGFAGRVKVGTGWGIYDGITGGSDLTGDGKNDLLATDRSGGLWLYPGTGNATAPFSARKKAGTGWGIYNDLTATGDLAGGPAGDLVARDTAGVLWLYLGKGDGTFAPRARLGAGWNAYSHLVGVGDADDDGRADLLALAPHTDNWLYRGTGDWRAPFKPRQTALSFIPTDGSQPVA